MARSRVPALGGALALAVGAASCTSLLGLDGSYSSGEGGGGAGSAATGTGSTATGSTASSSGLSASSTGAGGSGASGSGIASSGSGAGGGSPCSPGRACVENHGELLLDDLVEVDMVASPWAARPRVGILARSDGGTEVLDVATGISFDGSTGFAEGSPSFPARTSAFAGDDLLGAAHYDPEGEGHLLLYWSNSDLHTEDANQRLPPLRAAGAPSGVFVLTQLLGEGGSAPKAPLFRIADGKTSFVEDLCTDLPNTGPYAFDLATHGDLWTMAAQCGTPQGVRVQSGTGMRTSRSHVEPPAEDANALEVGVDALRSAVAVSRDGSLTILVMDHLRGFLGKETLKGEFGSPRLTMAFGRAFIAYERAGALRLLSCSVDEDVDCLDLEMVLGVEGVGNEPVLGATPAIAFDGVTLHLAYTVGGRLQRATVIPADL